MKTAGMIGGLGHESTIDYYRAIISRYHAQRPNEYPSIIINSLDVSKGIELVTSGRLGELADYLVEGVERLAHAGASFGFIAANTPHIVFDDVQRRSAVPLLSIVKVTCERCKSLALNKVGLLGTRFTMQGNFYPAEFQRVGIWLTRPNQSEQEFIHEKYLTELLNGEFLEGTRAELLRIACRMNEEDGAEAVILAGTELPLLLRGYENAGLKFLDTTEIHVDAIVKELLQ